jgi:thymidylate kinase
MNRIIMLEGCDRTGKSTFINYLEEKLRDKGYIPIVFHLMGPTKFQGFQFDNDDKSLIQLAKFNDEYDLIFEMLKSDERIIIILDRTSFGEFIWTKYWNRTGRYTDYVTSNEFIEKHRKLMEVSVYIEYYMSDIDTLEKRIKDSEEDTKIFTINNKSIKENIQYVYDLYKDLEKIVKSNGLKYIKIDSSKFKTLYDVKEYVNDDINFNHIMFM